jgi:hypothetical protein
MLAVLFTLYGGTSSTEEHFSQGPATTGGVSSLMNVRVKCSNVSLCQCGLR